MAEVDLVLALSAFSLRRVDRDLHRVHRAAHVADEALVVSGDQDVVIGVQMIGRLGKAAVPRARFGEGVPEQIELQLRCERRHQASAVESFDLALQDPPGRLLDGLAGSVPDVADHDRRPGFPRQSAQRLETGQKKAVGVAKVGAGDLKSLLGPVLDSRHQVIVRHRQALFDDHRPALGRNALAD